jgi:hypothetical protein
VMALLEILINSIWCYISIVILSQYIFLSIYINFELSNICCILTDWTNKSNHNHV